MIHVLCSRWGEKYDVEYVNKLYNMTKRNLKTDFKFYCQTDQTDGLDRHIEALPFLTKLPESTPEAMLNSEDKLNGLARLWDRPKLNYFDPECWGLDGMKIAFDLDMIIHNDMTPILDSYNGRPLKIRSWWHNMKLEAQPHWRKRYGARTNGSFYMWEGDQFKDIWDDLQRNWRSIYFVFHGGSDNFLTTRHMNKFDFLDSKYVYSFNRGCKYPDDLKIHKFDSEKIFTLFNTDMGNPMNLEIHEAVKVYPELKKLWK